MPKKEKKNASAKTKKKIDASIKQKFYFRLHSSYFIISVYRHLDVIHYVNGVVNTKLKTLAKKTFFIIYGLKGILGLTTNCLATFQVYGQGEGGVCGVYNFFTFHLFRLPLFLLTAANKSINSK